MIVNLFDIWFWKYMLRRADDPGYCSWFSRLTCRFRGHPCGTWYYNAGRLEPDNRCKDCGDDLG